MSTKIVNGKKPLSAKPKPSGMNTLTEDIFGNALAIPAEIQEDLQKRGLVGRFVSSKTLYANQGYHPRGWKVYKPLEPGKISTMDFKSGSDPEGLVRRGDCILAVKTIAEHQKHKDWLDAKADRYNRYSKDKAKELREFAKSAGADTQVDEGFGDDDDND